MQYISIEVRDRDAYLSGRVSPRLLSRGVVGIAASVLEWVESGSPKGSAIIRAESPAQRLADPDKSNEWKYLLGMASLLEWYQNAIDSDFEFKSYFSPSELETIERAIRAFVEFNK